MCLDHFDRQIEHRESQSNLPSPHHEASKNETCFDTATLMCDTHPKSEVCRQTTGDTPSSGGNLRDRNESVIAEPGYNTLSFIKEYRTC
jgi:hypothetical protein